MQTLVDLTKDFKEVNSSQAKEIYLLIDEIAAKVGKQSMTQFVREALTKFYLEMLS